MPPAEYDTTKVEEAVQQYLELDTPEEGSTREYLVRLQKDGD